VVALPAPVAPPGPPLARPSLPVPSAVDASKPAVVALAISPAGDGDIYVASAGEDGHIRFWRLADGERVNDIELRDGPIETLAFSRTGALLDAGTLHGRLHVLSVESLDHVTPPVETGSPILAALIDWSPNGHDNEHTVSVSEDGTVHFRHWGADAFLPEGVLGRAEERVNAAAIGYKNQQWMYLFGTRDGSLLLLEFAGMSTVKTRLVLEASEISVVAVSDEMEVAAAGNWKGTVTTLSVEPEKLEKLQTYEHKSRVSSLAVSSRGVIVSGHANGQLHVHESGATRPLAQLQGPVRAVALAKDGDVAVAAANGKLSAFLVSDGRLLWSQ